MGKNINKRTNALYCVDLDGTLVFHNYDPDIVSDVVILPNIKFFQKKLAEGAELCLMTARDEKQVSEVLFMLEGEYGLTFKNVLCNLPAGQRFLVNDYKTKEELKAFAINVERDKGTL